LKQHLSAGVKPFAFTDDQRRNLLLELPRRSAKNREAANRFVEAARHEVEGWLSLDIQLLTTTPKNHKEKLERLTNAASEIRAALDDIPSDTGGYLHAEIITTLHCDPYKRKHLRIGWKLKQLGIHDPCEDNFLEELLGVLEESASRMANTYEVRPGVDNGQMISLAAKLADFYSDCFQKMPSASNGSNFRKFMAELSTILGDSDWMLTDCFGAQTVQDAIERVEAARKRYAAPPSE